MSSFPDKASLGRVRAAVGDDTEVFLVNHAFELVARSVGALDVEIPPGLYKVKFRRGRAISQETLVLPPGTALVDVPVPAGFTPEVAEARPAARSASEPTGARTASRQVDAALAGAISVTIARSEEVGPPVTPSVRLCDDAGRRLADSAPSDVSPRDAILTQSSLPPGHYRLMLTLPDIGILEQTLVVCAGWRTEVRAGLRNYALHGEAEAWGADLGDATMLMAPMGSPSVPPDIRSYSRFVKAWLAGPQLTIATAHAERLVKTTIEDPLFGLCLAHALARQTELDKSSGLREPRARRTLLRALVEKLTALIPMHPDLVALRLRLGSKVERPFTTPPMLLNSWNIVSAAASGRPTLVPKDSIASLVPGRVWSSSTWLLWRSDAVSAPEASESHVARRSLIAKITKGHLERSKGRSSSMVGAGSDFTDLERAVAQMVGQVATAEVAPGKLAATAMKRLALPAATFDRALQSIVAKLDG